MGYDWEGEWDWTRWSHLSSAPEWREAYVDIIIEIVLYIFRAGVHTALDIRDIGKIFALGDSLELEVGVRSCREV